MRDREWREGGEKKKDAKNRWRKNSCRKIPLDRLEEVRGMQRGKGKKVPEV